MSAPQLDPEVIAARVVELLEDRKPATGLLTAQEAAERLSVPASWVLAEARANRIPHVRLGRYVRLDPVVLEAWWQTRACGPSVERRAA